MDRKAAASYAPLIMYAWDMCDKGPRNIPPFVDQRIAQKGWSIVGFLSASDDIQAVGGTIRQTVMGAGDRVSYGYVATKGEETIIAIRGTDGAEEWGDDLDFLMMSHRNSKVPGYVDQGFYSIYSTMQFHPIAAPSTGVPVVSGILAISNSGTIRVLGHSLGAALATYLTLDLNLAGSIATACLFASPKTGNGSFVDFFESTVTNYDLFNYERDVVPTVPKFDILHLSVYHDLRQAKTIPADITSAAITDNPACNHHLICYTALLDLETYIGEINNASCDPDDRNCAKCVRTS
ncbi:lipase family protein [Rhodoferax sp. GW822-FHT02A01]|uniref:lipase family protein n=1 Tax=Rhodoferax sp. GW822-FHT02A01 TaxID=3141537 RepID=UPI00315CC4E8